MSYIGRTPTVGNFQICDAISVVNNQAAYTMQVGSVNVLPETANHMIVSLNGVIQKPNSSFTVSGSTITFSSNLATGDAIDFIQILGDVLDLGVPSDDTVTASKLSSNAVTTSKILDANVTLAKLGADSVNATKIADGSIENEHLNVLAVTGQTAETSIADADTILIHDASASALRKMTKANFVSGIGGANTPYFLLNQSSATTVATGSRTKVNIDNAVIDTASGLDTTNKRWVVPSSQGGTYFVCYAGRVETSADFDEVNFTINKNGTVIFSKWGVSRSYDTFTGSFLVALSATDYLEMFVKQSSGSNKNISTTDQGIQTFFGGFKLI